MKYWFIVGILLSTQFLSAHSPRKVLKTMDAPGDENQVNMKFYHIKLKPSLDKAYLKAKVYYEYVAIRKEVSSFKMDFTDKLKVAKIDGDGIKSFKQEDDLLYIELEAPMTKEQRANMTIFYEGVPPNIEVEGVKRGMVYAKHGANDNPVIATVSYPKGDYLWFPCKKGWGDKADSVYVDITIENKKVKETIKNPKTGKEVEQEMPIIAVSNGKLVKIKKSEDGKTKTYKWRHRYRIAAHHIMVAVSNFAKVPTKAGKLPVDFYVLPERFEESRAMINRLPDMMAYFSRTFGPYPFPKEKFSVTQVGFNVGDGVPTQTNVMLESLYSTKNYQLVHQLSNQWFGNHISAEKFNDAWIPEAIATYAEAMWQEKRRGVNLRQMILDKKEYFGPGMLHINKKEDYNKDIIGRKGMYVIHMLRGVMGDTYFFEALRGITTLRRMKGTTYLSTRKFRDICEYYASENIDQDYGYFFDQWVYGEYFPIYNMSYSQKKGQLSVTIAQEERETEPKFFKMPIELRVILADGTIKNEKVVCTEATQVFTLPYDQDVKEVIFDPNSWIFKDMKYSRKVLSTKWPIEDMEINLTSERRKLELKYNVTKKQDVTVELIKVADGVKEKEDKVVSTQVFEKESGEQMKQFKIPVGMKERGVFILNVKGKSDEYTKVIRVKRVVQIF
ncbi:MAG: M1 family metallopeptidase [Aureispira sp.]|nr:M1 family metallopeptidase [Aureispira sp.]